MTLRQLRNNKNMTQEQLAEIVGVTPSQISYIESGFRMPSLKVALKISKVFNLPIEKIFSQSNQQKNTTLSA
jgi:putative transcriptional regulator